MLSCDNIDSTNAGELSVLNLPISDVKGSSKEKVSNICVILNRASASKDCFYSWVEW